jgi:hypothetical protein
MPSVDSIRGLPAQVLSGSAVGFHYRIGSPFQRFYVCGVCSFVPCVSRLSWHGRLVCMEPSCFLVAQTISRSSSSGRAPQDLALPCGLPRRKSPSRSLKLETGSAAGPIRLPMRRFRSISGAAGCIRRIVTHGLELRPTPGSQSTRPFPAGALRASTSGSVPRIKRFCFGLPALPRASRSDRPQRH